MQSGRVDLVIAPEEDFNRFASSGYLSTLEEWEDDYGIDDLFYAVPIDYTEGGAITEIPLAPHENTKDSECYGVYIRGGIFDGYVIGAMINCPNPERVNDAMKYFLETQ
jgi:hypothetical protein